MSALIEQLSNKYFFLHTCLCVVLSHLLVLYVFVCVLKYVNVFIDVPHHVVFWSPNEKYFDSKGFEKQPKIYKIENRPEHFLEHHIIIKSHFFLNYMYMYKTKIVTKDYWARGILEYFSLCFKSFNKFSPLLFWRTFSLIVCMRRYTSITVCLNSNPQTSVLEKHWCTRSKT